MKTHRQAVIQALGRSNGERSVARYLKRNPYLILRAFGDFGNHGNYVLAEFGLGKGFYADFVILQGYSTSWRVDFVELEPVVDPLFNLDRTPTRRLRLAQKQIADWREYADSDGISLRRQLADATKRGDLIKRSSGAGDPCTMSNQRLRDPESFVRYRYHIVIGRRHLLTKEAQRLRSRSFNNDNIDIATYDRIVDVAEEFDSGG